MFYEYSKYFLKIIEIYYLWLWLHDILVNFIEKMAYSN